MEPLCQLLGITVNELLAGESIPILDLMRSMDISRLELIEQLEFEQLRMRLYKLYEIEVETMEPIENGAGGLTYIVTDSSETYVVKYPSDNEMNHPDVEIKVCEMLIEKGIPACKFILNKQGKMLSTDENGRRFTVQHLYEGTTYAYNEAPCNMQKESAVMLAKIHIAMKNMERIPVGIGADFFKYRKPKYMNDSYIVALQQAINNGDTAIADAIRSNMRIVKEMPDYEFDVNKFSCGNTHGDYMISQLIWKESKINGVIDWTCVCKHPYIWEIFRSYVFMAPEVKQGEIDIEALINYIRNYMEVSSLNAYDMENAGNLFYYFLAVCNFYGQYYDSLSKNRYIYLEQANMASKLLVWFEKHIDELNERLCKLNKQVTCHNKLTSYYDLVGRLKQYPGKKTLRLIALSHIAACFEYGRKYTEKEVNEIIRQNILFSDVELIRRELYQYKLIGRLRDGSEYWREDN